MSADAPGPRPPGRRYKGLPVPSFFHEASADAFRALEMADDDVVLCSLAKGGTTWVHKILFSLLHGVDDTGASVPATAAMKRCGASGRTRDPSDPKRVDPRLAMEGFTLTSTLSTAPARAVRRRRCPASGLSCLASSDAPT